MQLPNMSKFIISIIRFTYMTIQNKPDCGLTSRGLTIRIPNQLEFRKENKKTGNRS